jgi:hypothetical protein
MKRIIKKRTKKSLGKSTTVTGATLRKQEAKASGLKVDGSSGSIAGSNNELGIKKTQTLKK